MGKFVWTKISICSTLLALAQVVSALVGVMALGLSVYLIRSWNDEHPPDSVNIQADHLSELTARGSVTATVSVYGMEVAIGGTSGTVEVVLPVAASGCGKLANDLGDDATSCPSLIEHQGLFDAVWTAPEIVGLSSDWTGNQFDVNAISAKSWIDTTFTGGSSPRLCLSRDDAAILKLREGATFNPEPTLGVDQLHTCQGVTVRIRSGDSAGASKVTFEQVTQGSVTLTASHVTLAVQHGQMITLTPKSAAAGVQVNGPVEIDRDSRFSVTGTGSPSQLILCAPPTDVAQCPELNIDEATHAVAGGAERLQSAWARYPERNYIASGTTAVIGLAALILLGLARWLNGRCTPAGSSVDDIE